VLLMWRNILFGQLFLRDFLSIHLVFSKFTSHPTTPNTHIHRY
jgi:hypothetical protein